MIIEVMTSEERAVLNALRELPDGEARRELLALMRDLVGYLRDPRCPNAQADGVPCATASLACEECLRIPSVLAQLRRRLPRSFTARGRSC